MIGFVYIWRDRRRSMYYVGSHLGTLDDGYVSGSRWMNRAYRRWPDDFCRRILQRIETGGLEAVRSAEERWLKMIRPDRLGTRYYNLKLAASGFDSATASRVSHVTKDERGKSLAGVRGGRSVHALRDENGKSITAVANGRASHTIKDENGKSIRAVRLGTALRDRGLGIHVPGVASRGGKIGGKKTYQRKDENGKSAHSTMICRRLHADKNEDGKSIVGVRGATAAHKSKDILNRSLAPLKGVHVRDHVKKDAFDPTCQFCDPINWLIAYTLKHDNLSLGIVP